MPLIECPDCLNQISDAAPACPHCGHPFEALPGPPKARQLPQSAPPVVPQPLPQTVYVKDTVMTRNRGCADLLLILVAIIAVLIVGGCTIGAIFSR